MSGNHPLLSRSKAATTGATREEGQVPSGGATAGTRGRHDPSILDGPILPVLLRLASPTIVVMLAQTGVNVAEAYDIGLLGTDATAAVALVFPIFMLMTWSVRDAIRRITRMMPDLPDGDPLEMFLPAIAEHDACQTLHRRAALAATLVAGLDLARSTEIALRQETIGQPIHIA